MSSFFLLYTVGSGITALVIFGIVVVAGLRLGRFPRPARLVLTGGCIHLLSLVMPLLGNILSGQLGGSKENQVFYIGAFQLGAILLSNTAIVMYVVAAFVGRRTKAEEMAESTETMSR